MQWNSHAYGRGSDDEEDSPYARSSYGHSSSAPRSLSQQLLATAKRWEAEREREASTQKMKLADANASLRSERNRVGTLTAQINTLTSEHAAAKSNFERALGEEKERVKELTEACKVTRTQALGSWLLLAELRTAVLAQLPPGQAEHAAVERPGSASDAKVAAAAKGEATVPTGDEATAVAAVSDGKGEGEGEGDGDGNGNGKAAGTTSAAVAVAVAEESEATMRLRVLLAAALPPLPNAAELLDACGEGKVRVVSEAIEAPQFLRESLRARAEGFLAAGLASSASTGNLKLCKLLLETGASVERSEALHEAVRGGHTALLQHFATNEACSVNTRDKNGASPLHLAAEYNQPKAAQFLMRHCAFVDAVDASGRSALQIANERRWREMQRVLQDHALLFWNRAARANKLYKAAEYESACEGYAAATLELEMMTTAPSDETLASFHFNHGRSCQALGRVVMAAQLFTRTLGAWPAHLKALEQRAECHASLQDLDSTIADWEQLGKSAAVEAATKKIAAKRLVEARATKNQIPRQVLGLGPNATEAEIRKAYKSLCLAHHPDKHAAGTAEAQTRAKFRFARIQAAYAKLSSAASSLPSYRSPFGRSAWGEYE